MFGSYFKIRFMDGDGKDGVPFDDVVSREEYYDREGELPTPEYYANPSQPMTLLVAAAEHSAEATKLCENGVTRSLIDLRKERCGKCSMCVKQDCEKCDSCVENKRYTCAFKLLCLRKVSLLDDNQEHVHGYKSHILSLCTIRCAWPFHQEKNSSPWNASTLRFLDDSCPLVFTSHIPNISRHILGPISLHTTIWKVW